MNDNINTEDNEIKEEIETEEQELYTASQWELVWMRFKKHKLAVGAAIVLLILYGMAIFAPFISPHDPHERSLAYKKAPPQRIHFIDEDGIHLFGTGKENVPIHLFGTDRLGRDMLGRVLYGARISLSIGLIGVVISLLLGILIGGLAGYYGGIVDEIIQRGIELLRSIPKLPLWMALSASLPSSWSSIQIYFAITIILSLIGWTGLARVVRGKFLSLREEDFVVAAELAGRNQVEIIFLHMMPSFLSHIIANLTLSIPAMILGETSLSFLGIGLRPPTISWGVLLKKAQNVNTIAMAPWLMIPGIFVIITVLAFNFLGDGLRDAADPYA